MKVFLKQSVFEALPTRLKAISYKLIATNKDALETIAEYADKIISSAETEISLVSNVSTDKQEFTASQLDLLEQQINDL